MEEIDVKQSLYIYNSGDLKRKDNTLRFTNYEGEKRDVPIERISDIYVMSETSLDKGTQRKTTENELPSLTQCTA